MRISLPGHVHRKIYFFGLALMAIGLPLSKFLMSLSQFILIGNWLLEGNIKHKIRKFWQNKSAVVLCSVFLLHLIGLIYTSDFSYGWEDIRKKLPLFIFPFIICSSESVGIRSFKQLLLLFVFAVFTGTMASMAVFLGIVHRQVIDIRDISIFVSHIRFSLMIDIAIFILGYYSYYEKANGKKIFYLLIIAWLTLFLFILNSLTGILSLIIVCILLFIYFAFTRKKLLHKIISLLFITGLLFSGSYYFNQSIKKACGEIPLNNEPLVKYTSKHHEYAHHLEMNDVENGHYVYRYICWEELEQEWNKKSLIKFADYDKKGQSIRYTIIRYMTSKGLHKDADGVNALDAEDIESIERGVTNANYRSIIDWGARLCEISWEINHYKKGGNPSGHSITQRYEYWSAALNIIKANPMLGVGTGDVKEAFEAEYERVNSPLTKEWRLRSHNQYLAIGVAFGTVGLLWFLFSLIYPVLKEKKLFNYFYITFFIIALLSMLTEDTLETQAGVSFFVFFNTLFLFSDREL